MQTRACPVSPDGDDDQYTVALVDSKGRWVGFDVDLSRIIETTLDAPPPQQLVEQASYHLGRGQDVWSPQTHRMQDTQNGWRTTIGKFHPTMMYEFAEGLRDADLAMPYSTGVTWQKLYGSDRILAVSFAAGATYDADNIELFIRKGVPAGSTGVPGTLTVELCADATGEPATTSLVTVTVDSSDIDDVTVQLYKFNFSSTVSLTASATYWIKVSGDTGDTSPSCWHIGVDTGTAGKRYTGGAWEATTYSPYFRVTDEDVSQSVTAFEFLGSLYALVRKDDRSASKLFINGVRGVATGTQSSTTLQDTSNGSRTGAWTTNEFTGWFIQIVSGTGVGQVREIASNTSNTFTVVEAWNVTPVSASSSYVIFGGEKFTEIASAFTTHITGKPVVTNSLVFFPTGDEDPFYVMDLSSGDADYHRFDQQTETGTLGNADLLAEGYVAGVGSVLWRANNNAATGSLGRSRISRHAVNESVLYNTDMTAWLDAILVGNITNRITNMINHENRMYVMKTDGFFTVDNDRVLELGVGWSKAPSEYNGIAAITATNKQLYVSKGGDVLLVAGSVVGSTGLPENLPVARSGNVSDLESAEGWLFAAIDADEGTSSVMMFALDSSTWSEHLRAPRAGDRIRSVYYQGCQGTNPRLWVNIGGDLVFQKFPKNGVRPINDTTLSYWPEGVLYFSPIDMHTVDEKHFSTVRLSAENLSSSSTNMTGSEVIVEYRLDDDDTWLYGGTINTSPIDEVELNKGNARKIEVRLRLLSATAASPVVLRNFKLTLFTRRKLHHNWQMYFEIYPDDDDQPTLRMLEWLREKSRKSEALTMKSRFWLYHDRDVTIFNEPSYRVSDYVADDIELEAYAQMVLAEVV